MTARAMARIWIIFFMTKKQRTNLLHRDLDANVGRQFSWFSGGRWVTQIDRWTPATRLKLCGCCRKGDAIAPEFVLGRGRREGAWRRLIPPGLGIISR